jgi:UDP-N-acetylmuramoyl-L-alanyl-D-glutamate--2,6-diaminopimelate ligase
MDQIQNKTCKLMTFDELLELVSSGKAPNIRLDSRLVKAGDVFIAVLGTIHDGHEFIDEAIANGAKYIVCQNRESSHESRVKGHETIIVGNSAEAAALLAQASKGNPATKLTNLAVTGTNGKTTVAFLVRSVIQQAGQKCGLIGTIIYDTGANVSQANLTTPSCLDIACAQQQMVKAGSEYMIIEASSHALVQDRLAGIDFRAAAFTNLSGDHLDYHKTKEDYLAAKIKLFEGLSSNAVAVLNKQSPEAQYIAQRTSAKILWYAIDEPADIIGRIESMDIRGTIFVLEYIGARGTSHESRVTTPLLGRYNVSNHLAAAGLCLAVGFDLDTIAAGLSALQAVPGRLEKVDCSGIGGQGSGVRDRGTGHVFIDYAHTDDALKNVLETLKPLCKGKLIIVFGCGGDRDRTKRPRMAKIAEQLSDIVIVTSDNPRTENPQAIIDEIVTGFSQGTECGAQDTSIMIEPNREKAIELAIDSAREDDIILIAGKGHETYQIVGSQRLHFSDKEVITACLRKSQ